MQNWHQRSMGDHVACQKLKKRWKLALYPHHPAQMLGSNTEEEEGKANN